MLPARRLPLRPALSSYFYRARIGSGFTVLGGRVALMLTGGVTAILLPIVAPHETVGLFFVAQTLIAGGAVLCQLGLTVSMPPMIAAHLASGERPAARAVAYSGLRLVLIAGLIMFAGALATVVLCQPLHLGVSQPGAITIIAALSIAFASLLAVLAEAHRAREAFSLASYLPLGSSIATASMCLVIWSTGRSVELVDLLLAGLAGLIIFTLLGLATLSSATRLWTGDVTHSYSYRTILHASWPNLVTTATLFILTQSDLWTVATVGSAIDLANYGVALRLAALILLPLATINGLISPLIVKFSTRGRVRVLQRMLGRAAAGAALVACLGYICFLMVGWRAIPLVWGQNYQLVFGIVAILGFCQVAHTAGGSAGQLLLLLGHQRFVMGATVMVGIATVPLGYWAMRAFGIYGLASAYGAGLIVQTIAFATCARRRLGLRPSVVQALIARLAIETPGGAKSAMSSERLPLVSIIIPTFNSAEYLGAAINSVLAQRYAAIELIVVDDGSTDDTAAVIAQFGSRLRAIYQPNSGQSAALNAGWATATGEILGYLSADDLLRPQAVAKGVEWLMKRPDIVAAYPDFGLIDAQTKLIKTVTTPDYDQRRLIAGTDCLPGPGGLFRRRAWEIAGGWNPQLRQVPDLDFFLRLALVGPFARIPLELADFRVHGASATSGWISTERSEEPMIMLQTFFSRTDLPPHVRAWQTTSYANAMMLSALMHAQSGRIRNAIRLFGRAFAIRRSIVFSRRSRSLVIWILRQCFRLSSQGIQTSS
jgi:glycosyltransferase involved in cell wall biosynthesis/O-antigen/teichoic acid export membrane protein